MPGNPKGGCQICKAIATAVVSSVEKVKTNFKLYAFLALIFIELFSIKLQNYKSIITPIHDGYFVSENDFNYAFKYYPLMANLGFIIMFLAIYLHSERLRFCTRQRLIVLSLIAYYSFNALFLIVPICWSEYSEFTTYGILGLIGILFLMTWRNI